MLYQGLYHPLTHGHGRRVEGLGFGCSRYLLFDSGDVPSHLRLSCPPQVGIKFLTQSWGGELTSVAQHSTAPGTW